MPAVFRFLPRSIRRVATVIERASPVELRKALELAQQLAQAGILFVPVPVLDQNDKAQMGTLLHNQMERFEKEVDGE